MSTTEPKADEWVSREVAVMICQFGNGNCECAAKGRRVCERAEKLATEIIRRVLYKRSAA